MLTAEIQRFGYRRDQSQLSNVSISLDVGCSVLLGPNGAGKTTLLKALAGINSFTGSLAIDGVRLRPERSRPRGFRQAVGWLPQNVVPFPSLTAREHVAYVGWLKGLRTSTAYEAARAALSQVGLGANLDDRADRLSDGQLRRLGIASVLVHEAHYLLLDEPTAGLDPRERDRLVDVLATLERTHAVLVSTHDTAALVAENRRILLLHEGEMLFSGFYDAFVAGGAGTSDEDRIRQAYASYLPED